MLRLPPSGSRRARRELRRARAAERRRRYWPSSSGSPPWSTSSTLRSAAQGLGERAAKLRKQEGKIRQSRPDDRVRVRQDERVRVLIVEDEDSIAEPLAEGLRREGFDVVRAATGAEALTAGDADVVLLDLRLPDMDGLDVCRRIRGRSAVPIIVVTARGEEADRVVGLELGADDYVVKPFGIRELIARIRAVTRRSQGRSVDGPIHIGELQ